MYKKGSESIVVHPSQVDNAKIRGWALVQPATKKKNVKQPEE